MSLLYIGIGSTKMHKNVLNYYFHDQKWEVRTQKTKT